MILIVHVEENRDLFHNDDFLTTVATFTGGQLAFTGRFSNLRKLAFPDGGLVRLKPIFNTDLRA